ncbi:MAG: hypothetical protein ACREK4_25190, partial [Candidatus Rokuibacteriota bacterium]
MIVSVPAPSRSILICDPRSTRQSPGDDSGWKGTTMRRIAEIALVISVAWMLLDAAGSDAAEDKFTLEIDKVIVEPGTQIPQGKAAVIRCQWSARFVADGSASKKAVNEVLKASGQGGIEVRRHAAKAATGLKKVDPLSRPGRYTTDSPLKGEFKADWIPDATGPTLATCFVAGPRQTARAEKSLPVVVALAAAPVESPQTAKSAAPTAAPTSKLEILSATGAPTADCGTISGHFLTTKLTIKNSGKPLGPHQGIVRVRGEYGTYPDNLSFASGDIELPEIKAGPANVVEVPVGFANL